MFFLYVIQPNIFERYFYFNEIFSLIGISIFFRNPIVWRKNDIIYNLVILFIGLGIIHFIFSIFRDPNLYAYLRHTAIIYSVFTFFVGVLFFQNRLILFLKLKKWLMKITLLAGLIPNIFDRALFSVGIGFFKLSRHYIKYLFLLILLNLYVAVIYKVATPGFVIIVLLLLIFLKNYSYFKVFLFVVFIFFIIFYIYFIPNFALVTDPKSFAAVVHSHPVLEIDHNTTFRFGLWYEIIFIDFWKNILGIGFGTRLFQYTKMPVESGEIAYYISGAHNTYITLFSRMGVLVILFFLSLYNYIFKFYFKYRKILFENKSIIFFIAFFSITAVGLFNLVLESPILASGYWGILGMVYGSVKEIESKFEKAKSIDF